MPLQKLQFRPGINRETTRYMNEGGWYDGNYIRFRFGVPEKIGGWEKFSSSSYLGIARKLHNWIALDQSNYLAVGTHLKLYIEEGTQFFDITPLRRTQTLSSGALASTSGSTTITVTDASHGAVTNDFVTFTGATTFAGIPDTDLNKEHQITVVDGGSYTITVATTANATTTGGGTPSAAYQINTGLDTIVSGTGWGAGLWGGTTAADPATTLNGALAADTNGNGGSSNSITLTDASAFPSSGSIVVDGKEVITYTGKTSNTLTGITRGQDGSTPTAGTGLVHLSGVAVRGAAAITGWGDASAISTTSGTEARIWSLDNFGEDLIACPRDGALFYWDKSVNTTAGRATTLAASDPSNADQVPLMARQVMVSDRSRHCIAFATNAQGQTEQDPLLIRFSKAESAVDWNILTTGTDAGDLIIGSGSKFVSAIETKREILVWTDVSLHSMQFIGAPNTFGLIQIASGISIIGPNSVVAVNDTVFWMGENQFYTYDGRTQQIPCTVRDYVFDDLNNDQRELITAGLNSQFSEIFWFYPSKNSLEVDKYVIFNYQEQAWYYGVLGRTAWLDAEVRAFPIAAGTDSFLYNHELGNDDGSTSPATPLAAYIESSPMSLESGEQFQLIRRVLPDITFDGSSSPTPVVKFTLGSYDKPGEDVSGTVNGTVIKEASETVEKYTSELFLRLRGRAFSVKIENTGTGAQWRLGIPRVDVRPDGKR